MFSLAAVRSGLEMHRSIERFLGYCRQDNHTLIQKKGEDIGYSNIANKSTGRNQNRQKKMYRVWALCICLQGFQHRNERGKGRGP